MTSPLEKIDSQGRMKEKCRLCGKWYHRVDVHLEKKHGDVTPEEYQTRFPGARLISESAAEADAASSKAKAPEVAVTKKTVSEFLEEPSPEPAKAKGKPAKKPSKATPVDEVLGREPEPEGLEMPEEEAPEEGVFKIGISRLKMRTDLGEEAVQWVPEHDPLWHRGDAENERWEYLALGIEARDNVMIVGPTGCGKTESVFQLAAALNQPVRRINMNGDIRAADFLGEKKIDIDPKTNQAIITWGDGLLPYCMRHGLWLLVDEIDAAPAHVAFVLQAVLEKHVLTIPATGETFQAHESFRIIATANTLGRGDESGLYTGTHVLNEAFLDRFGIVITADYPDKEVEADILVRKTSINREDATKMVDIAVSVRRALKDETCYCTLGTRRLLAWADKAVRLGNVRRAARIALTNRLGSQDKVFVEGLIQRVWGKD